MNILSKPNTEWRGKSGRINESLLDELLNQIELTKPLFCICGPTQFTKTTLRFANFKLFNS